MEKIVNMKKSINVASLIKEAAPKPKSAVAVVFNDKGMVLLGSSTLKGERFGKFCFPGGGIENGESQWAAAQRETKEETGIRTKILPLSPVLDTEEYPNAAFIVLKRVGGQLKPNEEFLDLDWFSLDALPRDIMKQNKKVLTVVKREIGAATGELRSVDLKKGLTVMKSFMNYGRENIGHPSS